MTSIPFTKLHGDENDFLLTWADQVPSGELPELSELPELARRICARTTGVGADGWMLLWKAEGGLHTRLFNSDGSEPEISGNGTRCAAAFALREHVVQAPNVTITTGAGPKQLKLISQAGNEYIFEMDMGTPNLEELHAQMELAGTKFDATLLNVGNPQCAIFVPEFPPNWRAAAAEAERHPRFPNRSNVSFVRILNRHSIEARFYERGAGETKSSGTGSTGAATAAILRGDVESPVEIQTPAGTLTLKWDQSVFLTGPAEVVAEGRFFVDF